MKIFEEITHYLEHHTDTDANKGVVSIICTQFHLFSVHFKLWQKNQNCQNPKEKMQIDVHTISGVEMASL